jgi:hypothetical protein
MVEAKAKPEIEPTLEHLLSSAFEDELEALRVLAQEGEAAAAAFNFKVERAHALKRELEDLKALLPQCREAYNEGMFRDDREACVQAQARFRELEARVEQIALEDLDTRQIWQEEALNLQRLNRQRAEIVARVQVRARALHRILTDATDRIDAAGRPLSALTLSHQNLRGEMTNG